MVDCKRDGNERAVSSSSSSPSESTLLLEFGSAHLPRRGQPRKPDGRSLLAEELSSLFGRDGCANEKESQR